MPSIGQELRRERELRGVALSDIAKITKINLSFLQALEEDRLNILPGEFFIKGMIRAYAKVVGLDEDQVLILYAHSLHQKAQDQVYEARKRDMPILKSRKPNTLLIGIAALFLAAVTALIFLGFGLRKSTRRTPADLRTEAPIEAKAAPPVAPKSAETRPESAAGLPAELSLQITFVQDTWIQVVSDGQPVLDQLKLPGERVTLSCRKEFILSTGNAGGFTFTLNGRRGKPLGGPGVVLKNILISPTNFREFLGVD